MDKPRKLAIKSDEKKIAYAYYMLGKYTQEEIARFANVTPHTVAKWINDPTENWTMQLAAMQVTRPQQIRNTLLQINELNELINNRPEGQRYPSAQESDILSKLHRNISALSEGATLAEYVAICEELARFSIKNTPKEAHNHILDAIDEFVAYKASTL